MTKHLTLLAFLAVLLSLSCCSAPDKPGSEIRLLEQKELVFDLGFSPYHKLVSIENIDGREVICFGNLGTARMISFFDFGGKRLYDVPLKSVFATGVEVDGFSIISKDSIVLLSLYTNQLFLLNQKGEIRKQIDLNKYATTPSGDVYEFSCSAYGEFIVNGKDLVLNCNWLKNEKQREPEDRFEQIDAFYKQSNAGPYFMKLENFLSNSPNCVFGLNGFYKKISKENACMSESPLFVSTDEGLLCFSWFSNKLFKVNHRSLKAEKELKIRSEHTKVGCAPFVLKRETIGQLQDELNKRINEQGQISRAYYDPYRKFYYVVVKHTELLKDQKPDRMPPFSLIVYDKDLKKVQEILLDSKRLVPTNLKVVEDGILISSNLTTRKEYSPKKARYVFFKVDSN